MSGRYRFIGIWVGSIFFTACMKSSPIVPGPSTSGAIEFVSVGKVDQLLSGILFGVDSIYQDYSIQRSQNSKIYRFEVRDGDFRPGEDRNRSELSGSPKKWPTGTDLWVSWSFMHETGVALVDEWNNLGQWHAGSGSPVVTIQVTDDRLLRILTRSGSSSNADQVTRYEDSGFQRGRWYPIVQHLKFNAYGNASVQVWIDGVLRVDVVNQSVGYTDSTYNYFKFGIYRRASAVTQAVQYANMEIGTESLAYRIADPLPIEP